MTFDRSDGGGSAVLGHPAMFRTGGVESFHLHSSCASSVGDHNTPPRENSCGSCPYCFDICPDERCTTCFRKLEQLHMTRDDLLRKGFFTRCEVQRHCTEQSCWIVANQKVYDVTTFLHHHPGGSSCLLKRGGGQVDATVDFHFHSKAGHRLWDRKCLGRLHSCPQKPVDNLWIIGMDQKCSIL